VGSAGTPAAWAYCSTVLHFIKAKVVGPWRPERRRSPTKVQGGVDRAGGVLLRAWPGVFELIQTACLCKTGITERVSSPVKVVDVGPPQHYIVQPPL